MNKVFACIGLIFLCGCAQHTTDVETALIEETTAPTQTTAPTPSPVPPSPTSEDDYLTDEEIIEEFIKPEYPTYMDLAYAYIELEDELYRAEEEIDYLETIIEEMEDEYSDYDHYVEDDREIGFGDEYIDDIPDGRH